MENKIYAELLSQGSYLRVSKRLIATLGLEMSVFLSFLIDKYEYYSNNNLLKDDYFYATNNDILIFTGLKENKIQKLKSEGKKSELFFLKKIGNPAKTYYSINFEKLNNIFIQNKSLEELSYERIFKEKLNIEDINRNYLEELSIRELRLVCKYFLIGYSGNDKKEMLIDNILKYSMKNKKEELFNEKDIENFSYKKLRELCKQLNISYSGNDKKEDLKNKILKYLSKKKVDVLVNKKIVNKWTNNSLTSDQKTCHTLKQNIITNNQKQITTTSSSFERYDFLDLEEFSLLNDKTIKNIRKNIENLDFEKFKKVYDFVKKKLDSGKVNNFNGFLYELLNKEWDINIQSEEVAKKEVSEDKKKWLNYYSGIINNQNLKEEVEKLIIDIPLEILEKNKSKLGMMNGFEFKQHLHILKKQSISS